MNTGPDSRTARTDSAFCRITHSTQITRSLKRTTPTCILLSANAIWSLTTSRAILQSKGEPLLRPRRSAPGCTSNSQPSGALLHLWSMFLPTSPRIPHKRLSGLSLRRTLPRQLPQAPSPKNPPRETVAITASPSSMHRPFWARPTSGRARMPKPQKCWTK